MSNGSDGVFTATISLVGLALVVILAFVSLAAAGVLGVGFLIYTGIKLYENSEAVMERKERQRTHQLFEQVRRSTPQVPDVKEVAQHIYDTSLTNLPEPLADSILQAVMDIYNAETFVEPLQPPPLICHSIEGAKYRD